jgi:hypothetical protein
MVILFFILVQLHVWVVSDHLNSVQQSKVKMQDKYVQYVGSHKFTKILQYKIV